MRMESSIAKFLSNLCKKIDGNIDGNDLRTL